MLAIPSWVSRPLAPSAALLALCTLGAVTLQAADTFADSNALTDLTDMAREAGIKKLYGVVSDLGVLREGWDAAKKVMVKRGVVISGEDFPSFGSKDFSVIIDKVARSGADGLAPVTYGERDPAARVPAARICDTVSARGSSGGSSDRSISQ